MHVAPVSAMPSVHQSRISFTEGIVACRLIRLQDNAPKKLGPVVFVVVPDASTVCAPPPGMHSLPGACARAVFSLLSASFSSRIRLVGSKSRPRIYVLMQTSARDGSFFAEIGFKHVLKTRSQGRSRRAQQLAAPVSHIYREFRRDLDGMRSNTLKPQQSHASQSRLSAGFWPRTWRSALVTRQHAPPAYAPASKIPAQMIRTQRDGRMSRPIVCAGFVVGPHSHMRGAPATQRAPVGLQLGRMGPPLTRASGVGGPRRRRTERKQRSRSGFVEDGQSGTAR